jgi:hypothetical protein
VSPGTPLAALNAYQAASETAEGGIAVYLERAWPLFAIAIGIDA